MQHWKNFDNTGRLKMQFSGCNRKLNYRMHDLVGKLDLGLAAGVDAGNALGDGF